MHKDNINPDHYKQGDVECIDAIASALSPEEYRGYLRGQVFKYLWRLGKKDVPQQEVGKAGWYLDRLNKAYDDVDSTQFMNDLLNGVSYKDGLNLSDSLQESMEEDDLYKVGLTKAND